MIVVDADGAAYEYVSFARSRRDARKEVRKSAEQWGASVVAIRPVAPRKSGRPGRERVLAVAGVTLGVSALTLVAMMILALSLEGLL